MSVTSLHGTNPGDNPFELSVKPSLLKTIPGLPSKILRPPEIRNSSPPKIPNTPRNNKSAPPSPRSPISNTLNTQPTKNGMPNAIPSVLALLFSIIRSSISILPLPDMQASQYLLFLTEIGNANQYQYNAHMPFCVKHSKYFALRLGYSNGAKFISNFNQYQCAHC